MKKKVILSLCMLYLGLPVAHASEFDSLAVFQKSDEVIALINEVGGEKLGSLMDAFTTENVLNLSSKSGDISFTCRRGLGAHSCTFKFKKSDIVGIHEKWMFAWSDTVDTESMRVSDFVHLSFKNKQGDDFRLAIDQFQIMAETHKK